MIPKNIRDRLTFHTRKDYVEQIAHIKPLDKTCEDCGMAIEEMRIVAMERKRGEWVSKCKLCGQFV